MNTLFALMAEFNTAEIPLELVAKKWWGLSPVMAKRAAAGRKLPVPAYRGTSKNSPWIIRAQDLANWIDERAAKARREWEAVNGRERPQPADECTDEAPASSHAA